MYVSLLFYFKFLCTLTLMMITMLQDLNTYFAFADKSLARPGRKQATATKLGIYSTYSPRSSIHFFALTFASQSKNKFKRLSIQPGRRGSNDLRVGRKMATFCFFSPGTGGIPKGSNPENRVGDKDIGSPGRPVSSGLQVPGELGHCRARTKPL